MYYKYKCIFINVVRKSLATTTISQMSTTTYVYCLDITISLNKFQIRLPMLTGVYGLSDHTYLQMRKRIPSLLNRVYTAYPCPLLRLQKVDVNQPDSQATRRSILGNKSSFSCPCRHYDSLSRIIHCNFVFYIVTI